MRKATILVVDDEEDILELVRYNLAREGYHITCVESGKKAIAEARALRPDVVILDLMLPDVDGLEVCRELKASPDTSRSSIIMLTAKTEEADIVTGLEMGADDYVTKPFSPRVLSARVKAVLRKRKPLSGGEEAIIQIGEITIHPLQHDVRVQQMPVDLTVTEFRILLTLARRPGWVFSREQIVDAARGSLTVVTNRSVDVHIVRLRSKLRPCDEYIETVRGVGYRIRVTSE